MPPVHQCVWGRTPLATLRFYTTTLLIMISESSRAGKTTLCKLLNGVDELSPEKTLTGVSENSKLSETEPNRITKIIKILISTSREAVHINAFNTRLILLLHRVCAMVTSELPVRIPLQLLEEAIPSDRFSVELYSSVPTVLSPGSAVLVPP